MRVASGRGLGLALSVLVLLTSGCHAWRVEAAAPREVIELQQPRAVRVTDQDGAVTVEWPRVSGDSITGIVRGRDGARGVPLREVQTIELSRLSPERTAGAIGLSFLGFYMMRMLLFLACCLDDS